MQDVQFPTKALSVGCRDSPVQKAKSYPWMTPVCSCPWHGTSDKLGGRRWVVAIICLLFCFRGLISVLLKISGFASSFLFPRLPLLFASAWLVLSADCFLLTACCFLRLFSAYCFLALACCLLLSGFCFLLFCILLVFLFVCILLVTFCLCFFRFFCFLHIACIAFGLLLSAFCLLLVGFCVFCFLFSLLLSVSLTLYHFYLRPCELTANLNGNCASHCLQRSLALNSELHVFIAMLGKLPARVFFSKQFAPSA